MPCRVSIANRIIRNIVVAVKLDRVLLVEVGSVAAEEAPAAGSIIPGPQIVKRGGRVVLLALVLVGVGSRAAAVRGVAVGIVAILVAEAAAAPRQRSDVAIAVGQVIAQGSRTVLG